MTNPIAQTLERLGISQAELARRTGYSRSGINRMLKGNRPILPRMEIILKTLEDKNVR